MRDKQRKSGITAGKLWIGIGILALISPLGLILPALFGAGGAWGEWGLDQLEKIVGFTPEGMKHLAGKWKAPLADYAVPGQREGFLHSGIGYVLAGLVGIAVTAGLVYLLAKLLVRKDGSEEDR